MKKILIIDNRGEKHHLYLDNYPFIEFYEFCNCPENINVDNYSTAIVHSNNIEEAFWAKRKFKPVFVISGDFENPVNLRGKGIIFNIPRETYTQFAKMFFEYYKKTGEINPDIFFGIDYERD